jgi:hypothetical protein
MIVPDGDRESVLGRPRPEVFDHPTRTDPPREQQTLSSLLDSLTGFEQEIIERKFRKSLETVEGAWLARAGAYIARKRRGPGATWDEVYSLTMRELQAEFLPEELTDPEPEPGKAPQD